MTFHYLAFFMGMFGSLHCVAMCGPLLFAVHKNVDSLGRSLLNRVLYQIGRILMYGILGYLLGTFGRIAVLQSGQQTFSLVIGLLLFLSGITVLAGKNLDILVRIQNKAVQPLIQLLSKWLYRPGGAFIAGVLNGVLPCGMVYMALLSAANANSAWNAFLFMVLFGLGTLPLLFIFSFFIAIPRSFLRRNFAKTLPYLYLLIGMWFILRGANLDIPYLSPLLQIKGAIHCA